MEPHDTYMRMAIQLADTNIRNGGGPFGAVIVRDGEVVGRGANLVTTSHDPTAHAEIVAIRDAAQRLRDFDLSGCVLYTSCEPCPMCLAAVYWSRIKVIYYGNTRTDAQVAGFDDSLIYRELALPMGERSLSMQPFLRAEAIRTFEDWKLLPDKTEY